MGFWSWLKGGEQKLVSLDPDTNPALRSLLDYPESKSGVTVNWLTALQVTTVLRCVSCLANGLAQVPLKVYRPAAGGRGSEPATDHPLYDVLYRKPNGWQTSFEFRQTLVFHRALAGRFIAYKNLVNGKTVKELIPLPPDRVEVKRNPDLSLKFSVRGDDNQTRDFSQQQIWYVPAASWDTYRGLDCVKLAREAIGLAKATEQSHAALHRNSARVSGILSVDTSLSKERYEQLKAWIQDYVLSGGSSYSPLIMDNAAKWSSMQMTGVDAQHVELRNLEIEEICRAFGVFPQMVGHAGSQTPTFASAEQFFIAHVVHTLGPWYADIEQSIGVNLLSDDRELFARFTVNALLRGAMTDEANYFATALGRGDPNSAWMTKNEVRALKDLNPLTGGDDLPKPPPPPAPQLPQGQQQ
jgi:HK97 family phage portal protein